MTDWSDVVDLMDVIEVDDEGMCRWEDVANVQADIRRTIRAIQPSISVAMLGSARKEMGALNKMETALQVIASWKDVDINELKAEKLREIIRNMNAVAKEALEVFPWEVK
jgi:hypothetical protein